MPALYQAFHRSIRSPYFGLLVITLLAAGLRFYRLGEWSFWKDEIFTLGDKQDGLHISFLGESLVRIWVKWCVAYLGESEWSARLVPAVIGTLSVPVLYFPVRVLLPARTALLTCALLAVSSWHIYWSQNARFYVLLLLWGALTLLFLVIGVEKRRPWPAFAAALACLVLAVRESLVALILLPVILGYLFWVWISARQSPTGLRWQYLVIVLMGLVAVSAYFALPFVRDLPAWVAGFGRVNNTPLWIFAATTYYLGVPTTCLGFFSGFYLWAQRDRNARWLLPWALLPLLAIMGLALFQYTAIRYVFISLPAWLILASLAADRLYAQASREISLLAWGVVALLVFAPLSEAYLYFYYQNGNREDGRAAYTFIRERMQPGDLVVAADTDVGDYYLSRKTFPMSQFDQAPFEHFQRVWFVEDLDAGELYPDAIQWVRENAMMVTNFDVRASVRLFTMRVYLYEVP